MFLIDKRRKPLSKLNILRKIIVNIIIF